MTTPLQAARLRLDDYVDSIAHGAILLDATTFKQLEDALIHAAMDLSEHGPF